MVHFADTAEYARRAAVAVATVLDSDVVMACPVLLVFVDAFRYNPMGAMTRMTRAAPERRFLDAGQDVRDEATRLEHGLSDLP
jgi:hypothetical protein